MKHDIILESISNTLFRCYLPGYETLNNTIIDKFNLHKDDKTTRKTHLFEGRYENIYIAPDLITELKTVLEFSTLCVEKITGQNSLRSGLWFNYMQPGQLTLPHSHDDADEIYSAVYYLKVPINSGDLIITENNSELIIKPKAGMLVLFPPERQHHVTINNSNESRLSLGINIGN